MPKNLSDDEVRQLTLESRRSCEPFSKAAGALTEQAFRENFPKLCAQALVSGSGVAAITITLTANFNKNDRKLEMLAQPAMMIPEATRSALAISLRE